MQDVLFTGFMVGGRTILEECAFYPWCVCVCVYSAARPVFTPGCPVASFGS